MKSKIKRQFERLQIEIGTVDGFQGQELDVVILTLVRTDDVGFLRGEVIYTVFLLKLIIYVMHPDEKRLNVALTRARYCLYVVTSAGAMSMSPRLRDMVSTESILEIIML